MKFFVAFAMLMATGAAVTTFPGPTAVRAAQMAGVPNPDRAHQNWMLKCQGCHRPDAGGTPATAPVMAGIVANFLNTPGGREYLARVPGVATAALPDDQLAELLNWTLQRYDAGHLPTHFKPYTAEEMALLRSTPLRTEAATVRAGLVAKLNARGETAPNN